METVTATFVLSDEISKGLAEGVYERVGGVIREVGSKQIVAWLREGGMLDGRSFPTIDLLNIGGILQLTSAASLLNLGVSAIGFGIVINRLSKIEDRLKGIQYSINRIEKKLDGVQQGLKEIEGKVASIEQNQWIVLNANFRAALDLADSASQMINIENRRSAAHRAIDRFLDVQHIYATYAQEAFNSGSRVAEDYISLLMLTHLAQMRCYLEMDEVPMALRQLEQGRIKLRSLYEQYINVLLTSNPGAYLHPKLTEEIDLSRLTKIYKWLDPKQNENTVFQLLRENFFKLAQSPDKWVNSLRGAVTQHIQHKGIPQIYTYLPKVLEKMESVIETYQRFESYQTEIKAIAQLGISFHDWMKLAPVNETPVDEANLMFIIPAEPIAV